jgi:hypothetical protein
MYEGISRLKEVFRPRNTFCKNKHGVKTGHEKIILDYFKVVPNPLDNGIIPQENIFLDQRMILEFLPQQKSQQVKKS